MKPYQSHGTCPCGYVIGATLVWAAVATTMLACSAASAVNAPPTDPTPTAVSMDIRPGLCPNHLRIESPLTIPVAIIGRVDFEIGRIDPESVRLTRDGYSEELKPLGWDYADVGTPIVGGLCACHKLQGDGIDDLELWFLIKDVVAAFDLAGSPGETMELSLRGSLETGEAIEGSDCATVISGLWEDEGLGRELALLPVPAGGSAEGEFKFAYQTMVTDRITFSIHDVKGRVVAILNDMDMAPGIYTTTWNGLGQDKEEAPGGIYFARVTNSLASDIAKITLSR